MKARPSLSIVSPVFGAEEIVAPLVDRIVAETRRVTEEFEVILVDDGSPDGSWSQIAAACARNPRIKGVRLTRNFGQQNAITAGLSFATGEQVIVMDCDLQDDPRYIPVLLAKARDGFDVVLTRRRSRAYGWVRNVLTQVFYLLLKLTGDVPNVDSHVHGFSLISRRVADAYLGLQDYRRDYLMLIQWMGFSHAVVPVDHAPRHSGRSAYTWRKLLRDAMAAIAAHSKTLLTLVVAGGFAYVAAAFVAAVYLVVTYYVHGYRPGWASTMVLLLASTGLILLAVGVTGIYIGNIFDQVRGRPIFLVQEAVNLDWRQPAPPRG